MHIPIERTTHTSNYMDDDSILIISSSPEPDLPALSARARGKRRATGNDLVDLTFESDGFDLAILDGGKRSFGDGPNTHGNSSGAARLAGNSQTSDSEAEEPLAGGSGLAQQPETPEDPIDFIMQQVLSVIPNVESEHLRSLVLSYQSQAGEDDVRLFTY